MAKKIESVGGKVEVVYYEGEVLKGQTQLSIEKLTQLSHAGEGHGFRQAKNIKDALDRSRAFLETTWGIEPA